MQVTAITVFQDNKNITFVFTIQNIEQIYYVFMQSGAVSPAYHIAVERKSMGVAGETLEQCSGLSYRAKEMDAAFPCFFHS